jgi:hypothetical protein
METKTLTKEFFLESTLNQVSQVYYGKRNCCRCGCRGKYTATTFMNKPRTEDINDELVSKRLERAKKLVKEGVDVIYGHTCVDVRTGKNISLTFYFDEIK